MSRVIVFDRSNGGNALIDSSGARHRQRVHFTENVGFFRGLSGIGWTMLRTTHPEVLPNVHLIQ